MAIYQVTYLALLLFGMILLASNVEHADARACTKECDTRIDFGICPYVRTKRIHGLCTNCCAGKKGCKYFDAHGNFVCEGESEYVSEKDNNFEKACTLNCDPRIEFGICPVSQTKRVNGLCINCFAGKKGCRYYGANGTFICDGESEYVSEGENDLQKSKVAIS